MACLYKKQVRGGWHWFVDFRYHGQRFRKSCLTQDKKTAQRIRDEIAIKIAKGTFRIEDMKTDDISLKDFTTLYIETYSKVQKDHGTVDIDKRALRRLTAYLGENTMLRHVTTAKVDKLRIVLKTTGLKIPDTKCRGPLGPTTINIDFRQLRAAFTWAMDPERGYVDYNPFAKIRQLKVDERRPRYMTPKELENLLAVVVAAKHSRAREFEAYLRTLLLVGSRRTETLELTWGQVDLDHRFLAFEKTKTDDFRTIPINDELCALLAKLKPTDAKSEDLLFHYRKESVTRTFRTYAKKAGLPPEIKLHGTRHTYATMQLTRGVPIGALKDVLGHHRVETTMRYAKILPDALRMFTDQMSLKPFETKSEEPIDKP